VRAAFDRFLWQDKPGSTALVFSLQRLWAASPDGIPMSSPRQCSDLGPRLGAGATVTSRSAPGRDEQEVGAAVKIAISTLREENPMSAAPCPVAAGLARTSVPKSNRRDVRRRPGAVAKTATAPASCELLKAIRAPGKIEEGFKTDRTMVGVCARATQARADPLCSPRLVEDFFVRDRLVGGTPDHAPTPAVKNLARSSGPILCRGSLAYQSRRVQ